jgi:vacuolar-type H+-ATPase subunit I/STV1
MIRPMKKVVSFTPKGSEGRLFEGIQKPGVAGHTVNMGINMFGGHLHSSRLQYFEFFTKFFEGGGRPFTSFAEVREHTLITQKGT